MVLVAILLVAGLSGNEEAGKELSLAAPSFEPGRQEKLHFTILHTNDEHSALLPHSQARGYGPESEAPIVGGAARLAAVVSQLRESKKTQDEQVLLVSAGDFLGGTPYGWLALQGFSPELSIMKQIGYDVVTLGNHEFDFGPDVLARYLGAVGYPETGSKMALVASNTHPPADHQLAEVGLEKKHLVELDNGLKIGFLGLLGSAAQAVTPDPDPVFFSHPFQAAEETASFLRQDGADIIVAVTHSGYREDISLARNVSDIDLIVGGHSHTVLEEPIITAEGTIIAQAGALLSHLGVLELAYNPFNEELSLRNQETGRPHLLPLDSNLPLYPGLEPYLLEYTDELDRFFAQITRETFGHILDPVAYSAFPLPGEKALQETVFGNFVTDAMRMVVEDKTEDQVDIALQSNGQIRGALIPSTLSGGITFYDLAVSSGLGRGLDGRPGYPLVSVYFKGGDLWRLLELSTFLAQHQGNSYFLQVSGLRFNYSPERAVFFTIPFIDLPIPTFRGVRDVEVYTGDGFQTLGDKRYEPLEPDKLYRVAASYRLLNSFARVASILPAPVGIVPRDEDGHPVTDLAEAVVEIDGKELKVWEALIEYAASYPVDSRVGVPSIPGSYSIPSGRINLE